MINLTSFNDKELSLIVANEEYLYNARNENGFIDFLKEFYIFTTCQMLVLLKDLKEGL